MFKLNSKLETGKWFDYPEIEGVRLKIRPRSMYALDIRPGENYNPTTKDIFELFNYSLIEWEGIGDDAGKTLPCNRDNKFALINSNDEIGAFVITTASSLRDGEVTEEAAKN